MVARLVRGGGHGGSSSTATTALAAAMCSSLRRTWCGRPPRNCCATFPSPAVAFFSSAAAPASGTAAGRYAGAADDASGGTASTWRAKREKSAASRRGGYEGRAPRGGADNPPGWAEFGGGEVQGSDAGGQTFLDLHSVPRLITGVNKKFSEHSRTRSVNSREIWRCRGDSGAILVHLRSMGSRTDMDYADALRALWLSAPHDFRTRHILKMMKDDMAEHLRSGYTQPGDFYPFSTAAMDSAMSIFLKCQSVEQCERAYDLIHKRYGVPMSNYTHALIIRIAPTAEEAVNRFMEFEAASGVPPDVFLYRALFTALFRTGEWRMALSFLNQMREALPEDRDDPGAASLVLSALAKAGEIERAEQVLSSLVSSGFQPTHATYNALLLGCAVRGDLERLAAVFDQMRDEGLVMPEGTYIHALVACKKTLNWERALEFYSDAELDLKDMSKVFCLMLELLVEARVWDRALQFFRSHHEGGIVLGRAAVLALARVYAELELWDDLLDFVVLVANGSLVATTGGNSRSNLQTIVRMCQFCGQDATAERMMHVLEVTHSKQEEEIGRKRRSRRKRAKELSNRREVP